MKAKFRILNEKLEQFFISETEDIAIIDAFDGHGPLVSRPEKTDFAKEATGQKFNTHFHDQEPPGHNHEHLFCKVVFAEYDLAVSVLFRKS